MTKTPKQTGGAGVAVREKALPLPVTRLLSRREAAALIGVSPQPSID